MNITSIITENNLNRFYSLNIEERKQFIFLYQFLKKLECYEKTKKYRNNILGYLNLFEVGFKYIKNTDATRIQIGEPFDGMNFIIEVLDDIVQGINVGIPFNRKNLIAIASDDDKFKCCECEYNSYQEEIRKDKCNPNCTCPNPIDPNHPDCQCECDCLSNDEIIDKLSSIVDDTDLKTWNQIDVNYSSKKRKINH